jgi:hypothetical protein
MRVYLGDEAQIRLGWESPRSDTEQASVAAALVRPGLLETTLAHIHGDAAVHQRVTRLTIRYLATGGAKRVYLITTHTPLGNAYRFVLKQFLPVKLGHLPPQVTVAGASAQSADLDDRLLGHMVWAARRVNEVAPGLCPRFGGFWQWLDGDGQRCRAMTEAYVEGHSLEHWKGSLEDRFIRGDLDFGQYSTQRQALERQGIAAYMCLWVVLGCRTFTSDPSPWNVLFTPTTAGLRPSIIDLHSVHDGGTPQYVFQTLEDMFGNRDEIREYVLCPGVLDALGRTAGVRFLDAVCEALAAESEGRARLGLSPYTASMRSISRFLASLSEDIPEAPATGPQPALGGV